MQIPLSSPAATKYRKITEKEREKIGKSPVGGWKPSRTSSEQIATLGVDGNRHSDHLVFILAENRRVEAKRGCERAREREKEHRCIGLACETRYNTNFTVSRGFMVFRVVGAGWKIREHDERVEGVGASKSFISNSCGLWAVARSYVAVLLVQIIRAIKNSRATVNRRDLSTTDSFRGERFSR